MIDPLGLMITLHHPANALTICPLGGTGLILAIESKEAIMCKFTVIKMTRGAVGPNLPLTLDPDGRTQTPSGKMCLRAIMLATAQLRLLLLFMTTKNHTFG